MKNTQVPWTRWWYDLPLKDFVKDKNASTRSDIFYMLNRLMSMFKYDGLPETIPKKFLDYYLFVNGHAFCTDVKDSLYVFVGGLGGEPDPYYRPTIYTVANPALNLFYQYKIGEEGVLLRNDTMMFGLLPLLSKYCSMLAENLVTMRVADINLRIIGLLTAPDDRTKQALDMFLSDLEDGKLGSIAENRFLDGIKMQSPPSNNGSYLTQFIELHQYLKGSMYNELGLNANFNMKREALGAGESGLNADILFPLVDDMLANRQECLDEVNKMFGTNIKVEFNSTWVDNKREAEAELKNLEAELEKPDESIRQEEGEKNDESENGEETDKGRGESND